MLIRPATVVAHALSCTAPNLALDRAAPTVTASAVVPWIARGGATAALDLGRTKLRLEGLHQYGVVTALLMNASLRLFSSTPTTLDSDDSLQDKVKIAFSACVAATVVFSAYTVIVFSLLGLYSKRALGLGMDAAFIEFFQATALIRESGFNAFLLVLGVDIVGWWAWSTIMYLANQILFSSSMM